MPYVFQLLCILTLLPHVPQTFQITLALPPAARLGGPSLCPGPGPDLTDTTAA